MKTNDHTCFVVVPKNTKVSGNAQHNRTPKKPEKIYNVSSIFLKTLKKDMVFSLASVLIL